MKKKSLLFFIGIIFASLFASASFAANKITESPKVKIIIDGKANKYSKTPINYNGRTMLPLREVLTNLGVKNDDEHIKWDNSSRSITLTKDQVNVSMKIGSKEATINKVPQKLDVEPIIYKDNTYIPARFVSQALGKKVVWDPTSNSVLIKGEKEYDQVKSIIENSNAATNDAGKVKCTYTADIQMTAAGQKTNMKMNGSMEMDIKNFVMHMTISMDMFGVQMKTEQYLANNKMYMKDPLSGKWVYTEMDIKEFEKQLSHQAALEMSEKMYAGLTVDESSNSDEIILKGDIFMESLLDQLGDGLKGTGIEFNTVYLEMSLDKTTYVPKSVKMKMVANISQTIAGKTEKTSMDMTMDMKYTDFNGNFDVKLPDEIAKTAEKSVL
jgi:hypothetical protein